MKKRMIAMVLVLVCLVSAMALPVSAVSDGYADVTIRGTQDYDEINNVLQQINKERTAAGLSTVVMDPILTAHAMQRAAEIAVYYSHTRPNGTSWTTALDSGYNNAARGENIAIGYADAKSVMTAWMGSEGHKANILYADFAAVGVGCFYQDDGTICWVQLFSSYALSQDYNEAGKQYVSNIPIQIAEENLIVKLRGIEECNGISLYQGTGTTLQVYLGNRNHAKMTPVYMDGGYSLAVSDPAIAQVDPETREITGLAGGSGTLTILADEIPCISIPLQVYDQPTLTLEADNNGSCTLSWEDTPGLAYLFGKEADDELWTLFAYPQPGENTYTHYGIFSGEEWTYVLRARNGDSGYVDISAQQVYVMLNAPEISISGDEATGANKLTWNSQKGETAYEVYRADTADGSFNRIATVTETSYIDTDAQDGQTYYYKIIALGKGDSKSPFSNVVSRTNTLRELTLTVSNVASSGKPKLTWNTVAGAVKYEVYRATSKNGTYTRLSTTTGTSLTNTSTEVGKTYYYKVRSVAADGTKSEFSAIVSRTCDLPRPAITLSNIASSGKIKITWEAIEGATKYEVYRSTDNTTWSLLKSTTGTSLTNTSATAGVTYYYKVRAIHEKSAANSAYSSAKYRTCDLPRPEITLSNIASSGKIKITWEAIEGATKYEVYRSTDNTTWSLLKSTTGTSLTDTSATAGVKYYYKVRAIHEKSAANSAYSSAKYRTCDLAQPTITMSNIASSGKIKITWEPIEGATKYEVYRSTDNKTWSLLKSTTGTSLTNTSTEAGKLYYYKVRAIASNSAANSAYSAVKNRRCDLPRPTLTVNLNSSGKPRLTWNAVEGAVTYEVYRSTDGKTWSLIKSTTGTALTNTSVTAGTTYYYKVRAIASTSSANSAYSTVKSITAE